jgi:hypothetical protein
MKLVHIIGPSAVGKMAVGRELADIAGMRLFHNHAMIEPVLDVFGDFRVDVVNRLRAVVFEEFARTDGPGMVYTAQTGHDREAFFAYLGWVNSFFPAGGVYYAELWAPLSVRLGRNASAERLAAKPSKRDTAAAGARLERDEAGAFPTPEGLRPPNYVFVDNSYVSARDAAVLIRDALGL